VCVRTCDTSPHWHTRPNSRLCVYVCLFSCVLYLYNLWKAAFLRREASASRLLHNTCVCDVRGPQLLQYAICRDDSVAVGLSPPWAVVGLFYCRIWLCAGSFRCAWFVYVFSTLMFVYVFSTNMFVYVFSTHMILIYGNMRLLFISSRLLFISLTWRYIYVCVCMCMYVCVCVCVCMYVCACVCVRGRVCV